MHACKRLVALSIVAAIGLISCSASGPPRHLATHPSAAPSTRSTSPAPSNAGEWPTYQHDSQRTGDAASGPNPKAVAEKWTSPTLDGDVYAQPLIANGQVIVATENDSVYSLDMNNGKIQWRRHLGDPIASSQLPCGNIDPSGITGTPVIDVPNGTVYAVAFVQPGHHVLAAMDLDTGHLRWTRPADDPGMDPLVQQQRAALLLDGGRVYVAYGGLFGDCGEYHGWVTSVAADGTGSLTSFQVPSGRAAGIWAPGGPVSDGHGLIYVVTGNSFSSTDFDFGGAVIALDRGLHRRSYFAPSDWADLNGSDTDVGSTGPLQVPGGRVFQIGKAGVGYLLDASDLGGIGGELFHANVCGGGAFGANALSSNTILVPCTDGLYALQLESDSFRAQWQATGIFAGPPAVGSGTAWTITRDGALDAFDVSSGHRNFNASLGTVTNFAAPSLTKDCVFAAADRKVHALCEP
ncbi:MAG: PQQ-binding-like beta-propeller repeat protein [Actinomycetota bacterium]